MLLWRRLFLPNGLFEFLVVDLLNFGRLERYFAPALGILELDGPVSQVVDTRSVIDAS